LIAEPFNLIWGSTIVVKITAFNSIGESEATFNGGAKIYSVPDAPRYINSDPTYTNAQRIGITWSDGASTGGYQIIDYEVQWALEQAAFSTLSTVTTKVV